MRLKFLFIITYFLFSHSVMQLQAQEEEDIVNDKYSVTTNSFWSNWFVQANVVGSSFWGSQEDSSIKLNKMFKGYRTNAGMSLAIGKWFTPSIGLRTKMNGFWGRAVISENKNLNANKYWTLHEQVLFNISNMFNGYKPHSYGDIIPYIGAGVARNMSTNHYVMGLSIGFLYTFRLSEKLMANIDLNNGYYEASFDGDINTSSKRHSFKNKDRIVNFEIGITYKLGKSSWKGSTDVDAMQALSQGEIDALNAQLSDAMEEIERLNTKVSELEQKVAEPEMPTQTETENTGE